MTKESIPKLKLSLYLALLKADPDTMTESDIDLLHQLARDADIQSVLDNNHPAP